MQIKPIHMFASKNKRKLAFFGHNIYVISNNDDLNQSTTHELLSPG